MAGEVATIAPRAEYELGRAIAEVVAAQVGLNADAITRVCATSERIVVEYGERVGPEEISNRVLTLNARSGLVTSDKTEV